MRILDRYTGEYKCEICKTWHDRPTYQYNFKTVCKECKEAKEEEADEYIDKVLGGDN